MLMNMNDVVDRVRLSETSIRRLIRSGSFPVARSLLGRRKVWLAADIDNWLAKQIGTAGDQTQNADHKSGNWLQSCVGDLAEWGRS